MAPTQLLIEEHEVIAKGLAALLGVAQLLERRQPIPPGALDRLLDFFQNYADRHHHAKEELLLFPALLAAGLPAQGGPIEVMMREHELGRALVRRLRTAARALETPAGADGRAELIAAARAYVHLLGEHIRKENNVLFPLADRLLRPQQASALQAEFASLEAKAAATHCNEAWLRAVEEVSRQVAGAPLAAAG